MYVQCNKGECVERISYFQIINEGIPLVDAATSNWFALHGKRDHATARILLKF